LVLAPYNLPEKSPRFSRSSSVYFISMQRAGHHAIINWLSGHYKQSILRNDFYHEDRVEHTTANGTNKCTYSNIEDFSLKRSLEIIRSDSSHADPIIILVVRDPYNLFASRCSARFTVRSGAISDHAKIIWKDHANEYLSRHQIDFCISYNEWFLNQDYRIAIASIFGLDYNEDKLNQVPEYGFGSSFDGLQYNGRASQMKVLERWKEHKQNAEFLNFIRDTEMKKLSTQIFGEICSF